MVESGVAYVHLTATAAVLAVVAAAILTATAKTRTAMGIAAIRIVSITLSAMIPLPHLSGVWVMTESMCTECGKMVKANYKDSLGHAYQSVVVREATCETPGKTMDICERCGNVKESTIPQTEHEYETQVLPATCTSPGYTLNECVVCGTGTSPTYPCAVPRLCRQDHPGRL